MSENKWEKLQAALGATGISIKDVAEAAGIAPSSLFRRPKRLLTSPLTSAYKTRGRRFQKSAKLYLRNAEVDGTS